MARSDIDTENKVTYVNGHKLKGKSNPEHGGTGNSKSRVEYMSQPNVKKYNKLVREHHIGKPYAFDSREQLEQDLVDYFNTCDDYGIIPTVMGAAMWLGVHRDTIYSHANNSNSPYADICKNLIDYCHMTIENGTIAGKVNPVTFIFLSKNYYGLSDQKEIKVSAGDGDRVNAQETATALQKQLEEETTPNADIVDETTE